MDRRFVAWAALGTGATVLGFGVVSAIIPNPLFGRSVAPEPFAYAIWLVSAPLAGLLLATYLTPPAVPRADALPLAAGGGRSATDDPGGTLGAIAGFGAFLAIGCPACNKVALVLLGASGALSVWAPLQPVVGWSSVALLAAAVVWRLRMRRRDGACPVDVSEG